jgi:hypothetical protein
MKSTFSDRLKWAMGDDTVMDALKKFEKIGNKISKPTFYTWLSKDDMPEEQLKIFSKIYNVDPAFIRYGGKSGEGAAPRNIPRIEEIKEKSAVEELAEEIINMPKETRKLMMKILSKDIDLKDGPKKVIKTREYQGPDRRGYSFQDRRTEAQKQISLPFAVRSSH